MNFFMKVTGEITNSLPAAINQGGEDAHSINLYTPTASNVAITASFKLPNGEVRSLYAMTNRGAVPGVQVDGASVNLWTLTLPGAITRYYGTVTMQFFVSSATSTLASTYTAFTVGRGVPQVIEDDSPLETILENIAALQNDVENGYFAARAIHPWSELYTYAAGEVVWYPNVGEHGAFVKSLVDDNTTQPYDDNENINGEYWQEEVNFNNITEEFYDQLREIAAQAQASADNAAESAAAAAQVVEDIGSLADRTVQIVTEVPSAENADPDVIYAVVVNADNNLFELYALVGGEMKDLGGANFVSNGTEVSLVTLRAAGWSENRQTVEVNNASPDKHMSVSVVDSSAADYINNGVTCSEMGSGTLTFTCERVPDNDINVLCVLDTTNIVPSLADYYTMPQVDKLLSDLKADSDSADDALQSDIAEEAQAREAADTTLQNNINAEATARTEADTALGERITSETSAREAADTTLQQNITAEENARKAADTTLQSNIDAEVTSRKASDSTLQGNIDNEATLRQNADTALGGRIDDVVDGTTPVAKATSATNDGSGNNIASTYATKAALEDYYTETEANSLLAQKQDITDDGLETTAKTVVSAINEVNAAIAGLRDDVVATEHFKGFAADPTAVQAMPGDLNDYCYCISTGTIWTYEASGWTNSNEPYPSDATPLSDSAPIMDGTAAAGSSSSAARADHVHPTDTSRASTQALANETTARQNADTTLQNNINAEESAREAADTTLQNNIDAEEQARIAADNTKVDKVTSTASTARAYVAESNGTQSTIPVDAATSANSIVRRYNNGAIDVATPANDSNAANKGYVDTQVESEASAREAADTALGGRIDDIVDGTTPIDRADTASYADGATNDSQGRNIANTYATKTELTDGLAGKQPTGNYALQTGTYSGMTVGNATKATQDGEGNNIADTYATKAVATQTAAGLMSAADKTKLDGMSGGGGGTPYYRHNIHMLTQTSGFDVSITLSFIRDNDNPIADINTVNQILNELGAIGNQFMPATGIMNLWTSGNGYAFVSGVGYSQTNGTIMIESMGVYFYTNGTISNIAFGEVSTVAGAPWTIYDIVEQIA